MTLPEHDSRRRVDLSGPGLRRRGSNLPRVADHNRRLVLEIVRRSPGTSRTEMARLTGLSAQAVSNICRDLVEAGLIRAAGRDTSGTGAPRTLYEVEPRGRLAVGLHIDPARLTLATLDLSGAVLARADLPTPDSLEPGSLLDLVEDAVRDVAARAEVLVADLAGVGVATPGPLDVGHGVVLGAPNLTGWEHVPLRAELESRLRRPVVVEKDSTVAALGELWCSPAPDEDFAFVYLGTGSAAGIVLDGEVRRGSSSNLGDIGHLGADPDGPLCPCGGRGCLAATSMPSVLVAEAVRRGVLDDVPLGDAREVGRALTVLGRAADADPAGPAAEVLEAAARRYARVGAQLANVLDLAALVFGGPAWPALAPTFLRVVPAEVDRLFVARPLHGVSVRGTALDEDVAAVGAASLALWTTTFDAAAPLTQPG